MTAPKVDTIRRYCDSGLAVEILAERGLLSTEEASRIHARDRAQRDAAYDGIYRRLEEGTARNACAGCHDRATRGFMATDDHDATCPFAQPLTPDTEQPSAEPTDEPHDWQHCTEHEGCAEAARRQGFIDSLRGREPAQRMG